METRKMNIDTRLCVFNDVLGLEINMHTIYDYNQVINFLTVPLYHDWGRKWCQDWPKKVILFKQSKDTILCKEPKKEDQMFYLENDNFKFVGIDTKPKMRTILNSYINEYDTFSTLLNL